MICDMDESTIYTIEYDGTAGGLQAVLQEVTGRGWSVAQSGRLGVEARGWLSPSERAEMETALNGTVRIEPAR